MSLNVTRRQFIGTSLVLTCLPAQLFAQTEGDVVARMAIMSDVHFSGSPDAPEVERFRKALAFMYEYSAKQPYKKFDALLVAGDMTNHGIPKEIDLFKKELDAAVKPGTQKILCMGNHEFGGGNKELWKKTFQTELNDRYDVNGFQVITISPDRGSCRDGDYLYAKDWLKKELDAAKKFDSRRPIFVMQHYHVTNTVYGSLNGDCWGIQDLDDLFQQYPMVIDFSGHSHYPINDPRSAWQGNFSAFGTGTLSYFEMEGGNYDKFPDGYRQAAQFYVMEVHKDNSVVLKPYDILSGTFFDIVFLVSEPGNIDKFLYTNARYQSASLPYWTEDAKVEVVSKEPYNTILRFPQGKDEIVVHSYRLDLEKKIDGIWKKDGSKYFWSEYYFKPMPKEMNVVLDDLEGATDYRVQLTVINAFAKESTKKITAEFRTIKDEIDENVDKTTDKPHPNLLDITFNEKGAVNTPVNGLKEQKPVVKNGAPKFIRDSALGIVAAFGGKDFFKVKFSSRDFARMRKEITIMSKFRMAEFEGTDTRTIFSSTESGGNSLEINQKKKSLEFWVHINGKYVILSTPITAEVWHTAYGVYNGKKCILYLDGKVVAEASATGNLTYTTVERAKAYCVGADINSLGSGDANFKGLIATARLYGWALSPEQINNLEK